tara:strand:- start:162 stop:824 length:663 start_codon:yes stop_codon:yes gene_type:complete
MTQAMQPPPETLAAMQAIRPVSSAQVDRLRLYAEQLLLWQRKTNLVAPSTLDAVWQRHFLDSWQVLPALPEGDLRPIVDLGSGGGFPGLIIALAGAGPVHLIESNRRKASFLQSVAAQMGVAVTVHASRIEDPTLRKLAPAAAITARACAGLSQLLQWAHPLVDHSSKLVFLKGQSWRSEVADAERQWSFVWTAQSSVTEPDAAILTVSQPEPRCAHARP